LHFPSKNPEEENGAVVFTYQSSIPAFKGEGISHRLGLKSTSSIRLLCHMLREPLFDELRTKQQLGYIVNAYYDFGYSSRPNDQLSHLGPLTSPVDYITINILSRKMAPPDIANRIEDFLAVFRESLASMPESEIRDHADALSTKLLKPIQKLQTEATTHFGRILRYGPEIFYQQQRDDNNGNNPSDRLPWDATASLARGIKSLTRSELLETWDRMIQPTNRSRVVCCVYGNTFPLSDNNMASSPRRVVSSFSDLIQLRKGLQVYNDQPTQSKRRFFSSWIPPLVRVGGSSQSRLLTMFGIGVLGAGVVGLTMAMRNQKSKGWKR
jgi:hypothetical protein